MYPCEVSTSNSDTCLQYGGGCADIHCVHRPLCGLVLLVSSFFSGFSFCFFYSTGLVRLYIAGLPLRSCQTIGAPSVQGSAQCLFFRFWQQQDWDPQPGAYHADILPLRHCYCVLSSFPLSWEVTHKVMQVKFYPKPRGVYEH